MTYSIVGRDPATGQLGVAVQSAAFASAAGCIWAEAGVGAVATQSFTDRSYGPIGLSLLAAGRSAQQALNALIAADAHYDVRQVGMVNLPGRRGPAGVVDIDDVCDPISFTGEACVPFAGDAQGADCAAQANMMVAPAIPEAMVDAFESSPGDLGNRLLTAMDAAQSLGGDFRGVQSCGLMVREGSKGSPEWQTRLFNLRVDDHAAPLVELRRLMNITRAANERAKILKLVAAGKPVDAIDQARHCLADNTDQRMQSQLAISLGIALAAGGDLDEARSVVGNLVQRDDRWRSFVEALLRSRPELGIDPLTLI